MEEQFAKSRTNLDHKSDLTLSKKRVIGGQISKKNAKALADFWVKKQYSKMHVVKGP
jgi:hypothetical protein